uniref:Uncharacterized protein n=1 Tax=Meloidogyne enterolobii TaxID=390850 RepID=A0A6V7UKJ4_MELEN|nr:unnamed protein product [Meloidogyne enterolobii]
MFKSSLLFVSFLFTIFLFSNKFSEISAKPKADPNVGLCTGKCNSIDRGDICCLLL